ncbi:MAG TPA: response regulator transcription factor [Thermoanaerobaculia bacterium]|nr:response regulator transcription factor [Thermoanaerobaculia bacterium]
MSTTASAVQLGIFCECASFRQALGRALKSEDSIERVVELEDDGGSGTASSAFAIDVLLFAVSAAHRFGEDALRRVQDLAPRPKVLLLSLDDDSGAALHGLQAGAAGIVSKLARLDELLRAIQLVHAGKRYLSRPFQHVFADRYLRSRLLDAGPERLSKRETEVLRLLALGSNHHEISRRLFVSVKTVDTHRGNILRKLKLRNNADLARYAIRSGLIDVAAEASCSE